MLRKELSVIVLALLLLSSGVDAKRHCEASMATQMLISAGVFTGAFAGTMVAGPAILSAVGFGSTGIVGGSFAAGWQSIIGNVAAKSIFAKLQSLGMTGVSMKSAAAIAVWAANSEIGEVLELALGLQCYDLAG